MGSIMYRKFSANQTTHKLPLVLGIASRQSLLCIAKRGEESSWPRDDDDDDEDLHSDMRRHQIRLISPTNIGLQR